MQWFLGADTIVLCKGKVFGKPSSAAEAEEFISYLSGKKHKVITALAFFNRNSGKTIVKHDITSVFFSKMTKKDIKWYISTNEWQGAAGGYRIQGKGEIFISHIEGSYSNVMGLPIQLFFSMLCNAGYPVYNLPAVFPE
jgi:septum formation protein